MDIDKSYIVYAGYAVPGFFLFKEFGFEMPYIVGFAAIAVAAYNFNKHFVERGSETTNIQHPFDAPGKFPDEPEWIKGKETYERGHVTQRR